MRQPSELEAGIRRHYRTDPRCRLVVAAMAHQPVGLPHSHNLAELVVVRSGTGLHRLGDRDWPIAAGEVFLIPPGATHCYRGSSDLALDNFLFEPLERWLPIAGMREEPGWRALFEAQPSDRPGGRLRLRPDELREVVARSDRLQEELAQRRAGWAALASGEFLALVAALVRLWPQRADAVVDPRLAELLPWIAAEHARPLATCGLARRLGLTERSLQRLFRSELGCTPKQHLERVRLEEAARLLADPRRSVGEVAAAVGFSDASYFARRWRSRFGRAPARSR